MKKVTIVATAIGLLACFTFTGCGQEKMDAKAYIASLEAENGSMEARIESLTEENAKLREEIQNERAYAESLETVNADCVYPSVYTVVTAHEPKVWLQDLPEGYDGSEFFQVKMLHNLGDDGRVEGKTYGLDADGVHQFSQGVEIFRWDLDVTPGSRLIDPWGYSPCVWSEERIVFCAEEGPVTLMEGVIDYAMPDEETEVVLVNHDGTLAYYGGQVYGQSYSAYQLADNVVEALRLGSTYDVICVKDDGVYIIPVSDYRICDFLLGESCKKPTDFEHYLGSEPLSYYLDEYAAFQAELRQEGDPVEYVDDDAVYLLLGKYCKDCEFSAENIVE